MTEASVEAPTAPPIVESTEPQTQNGATESQPAESKTEDIDRPAATGNDEAAHKPQGPRPSGDSGGDASRRGGSGRHEQRQPARRHKTKFDPSSQPETDDPVEIRKQVEFYFSDANLVRDKFLFEQTGGPANAAVPVKLLHGFKRMKRFQPFSAVVDALRASDVLDVVGEGDGEKVGEPAVKRKTPLALEDGEGDRDAAQKAYDEAAVARTAYAKGFGAETKSTQTDVEAFFAPLGEVRQLRLRRFPDKGFKGSVFVEFDSDETLNRVLEKEKEEKMKYGERELVLMSKKEYNDQKEEQSKNRGARDHRGGRRGKGRDDRHWDVRREDDRKKGFPKLEHQENGGEKRKEREDGEDEGEKSEAKKARTEEDAKAEIQAKDEKPASDKE